MCSVCEHVQSIREAQAIEQEAQTRGRWSRGLQKKKNKKKKIKLISVARGAYIERNKWKYTIVLTHKYIYA